MSRDFHAQSDWTWDHQERAVIGLPGASESDRSSDPECSEASEPRESCLELSKESVNSLSLFYTHTDAQIYSLVLSVFSTAASENTL